MIPDESAKGYRIILQEEEDDEDEDGNFPDLFEEYEGCSPEEDWPRQAKSTGEKKDEEQAQPVFKDATAWLRRYYNQACRSFDSKITNAAEETRKRNGIVFGDYTMSQVYMPPYVDKYTSAQDREAAANDKAVNGEALHDVALHDEALHGEALLDYVEDWYLGRNQSADRMYGRVIVLHGHPGDGKTTFCKKAVYAHSREGWLPEAPHVLWFSLNPAASDIALDGTLNLYSSLCLKEGKNKYVFDPETILEGYPALADLPKSVGTEHATKNRKRKKPKKVLHGALVILDAYDELKSAIANDDEANSFEKFCNRVLHDFAEEYHWNVIITSRSMCIEYDLKSEDLKNSLDSPAVSFAPMGQEQQEAMLDRMIELDEERDRERRERKAYVRDQYGKKQGDKQGQEVGLRQYKAYLQGLWKNKDADKKTKDFKDLLKVPILFRMIAARRFMELSQTETVTELYGRLFHSLLSYKGIEYRKDQKTKKDGEEESATEKRFDEKNDRKKVRRDCGRDL